MKTDQHVIVRSRDAGVLFGNYKSHTDSGTVVLENARQLWKWRAAKGGTLLDCAEFGVTSANCKFSIATGSMTILGACAIIECTPEAVTSIQATKGEEWN